jgi:hypothetical protein
MNGTAKKAVSIRLVVQYWRYGWQLGFGAITPKKKGGNRIGEVTFYLSGNATPQELGSHSWRILQKQLAAPGWCNSQRRAIATT